jgi:hypothetical protein
METEMRKILAAVFFVASLNSAYGADEYVRITGAHIEPEMGETRLRYPAYIVGYTVENTGDQAIVRLDLTVLGRNSDGRIVERIDNPAVTPRNLPGGLVAGDSIVQRHALIVENPSETVVRIEVRVREISLE